MKTVVFAYNNIGVIGIKALIKHNYKIKAVFTHKDNPTENIWFDSVAELCAQHNIPVYAPKDVNEPTNVQKIIDRQPDIIFSFYYRELLSSEILDIPPKGCFNLHGSLLPRYRGCAPINWAIINGEKQTGVTLHRMTSRADAGAIIAQKVFDIADMDTAIDLHKRAAIYAEELLNEVLPEWDKHIANEKVQSEEQASYFGRRYASDGEIDFNKSARDVCNLIRGVTKPFPGAFTYIDGCKYIIWKAEIYKLDSPIEPGQVISTEPFIITCGTDAILVLVAQAEGDVICSGEILCRENSIFTEKKAVSLLSAHSQTSQAEKQKVLILGVNGFIGSHLSEQLLESNLYEVYGIDLFDNYIDSLKSNPDFHFFKGNIECCDTWIQEHIRICDIVLPLVAIATPIEYVRNPLRVFNLDFEENLKIIRYCHQYRKRVIFPSTSEVYAMCDDSVFDENSSSLILGPIHKQRWIYSCCKQLLDRVIYAYGERGLNYTIFRPFNWIGPKLDSLNSARIGSSRVITQFILNLTEGKELLLIDGGEQMRCFTDVKDGIECLYRIIKNKDNLCDKKIINIGNPNNELSIKELAEQLVALYEVHPLRQQFPAFTGYKIVNNQSFYGEGYQDCKHRKPAIENAMTYCSWTPSISINQSLSETLNFFLRQALINKSK